MLARRGLRANRTPYELAAGASVQDVPYVSNTPGNASFLTLSVPHTKLTYHLTYHNGLSIDDPLGRVRSKTTPDGRTSTASYNGIRTGTLDTDSKLMQVVVDPFGRKILKVAYLGSSDNSGVGMRFDYTHDGAGRLTSTMVGLSPGTTTTIKYDTLGRKEEHVDPDAGSGDAVTPGKWRYRYDKGNNLVWQDDPKPSQHVELCYDELDRVTRRILFANDNAYGGTGPCTGTPSGGTIESAFVYDDTTGGNNGKGRLTFVSDLAGSQSTVYDSRGRVTKSIRSVLASGNSFSATMEFTYDTADRQKTVKYPDGEIVTYTYQADGSLGSPDPAIPGQWAVRSTVGTALVVDVDYDIFGRATHLEDANGAAETVGYWDHTQNFALLSIDVVDASSAAVLDLTYAYHPTLPKIQTITDGRTYGTPNLSNGYMYSYDDLGRLSDANWSAGATYDESFEFDALGNITTKNGVAYSYDNDSTPHPHQATAYGTAVTGLTYDLDGNRLTRAKGATFECYQFNPLNQLTQVKTATASGCASPTKTIAYGYDYGGRRAFKVPQPSDGGPIRYFNMYFESQSGVVTKHYYAGSRRIASRTKTLAGYSELPPGFFVPREPLPGPPLFALGLGLLALLIGVDRRRNPLRILAPVPGRAIATAIVFVLAQWPTQAAACGPGGDPAAALQFYHVDHLGSTLAMTDQNGALFRQVRYTAYGDIRGRYDAGSGTLPASETKRHEFTTYETETETGLQYAHARYYDPTLTMFLSHDPDAVFASPYAYTAFDPVNSSDPTGREPISIGLALFLMAALSALLQAVYVGQTTGDWGAAFKGFAISVAVSAATWGLGVGLVQMGLTHAQAGLALAVANTAYGVATGPDTPALLYGVFSIAAAAVGVALEAKAAAAVSGVSDGPDWKTIDGKPVVHTVDGRPPEGQMPSQEMQDKARTVGKRNYWLTQGDKGRERNTVISKDGTETNTVGPASPYTKDKGIPTAPKIPYAPGDQVRVHSHPGPPWDPVGLGGSGSSDEANLIAGNPDPVSHAFVYDDYGLWGYTYVHADKTLYRYFLPAP